MNVFNKGDKVKIIKCGIHKNCKHIGKIFTVEKMSDINNNAYKLEGCDECFFGNELELVDKLTLEGVKNIKLEVGDRVTFKNGLSMLITTLSTQKIEAFKENEILKIERPKYEVIEYTNTDTNNSNILTDEERDFLKSYIKIIESLNNGEVINIRKQSTCIAIILRTQLEYQAEIGPRFKGMEYFKKYTLEELGL